MRGRGGRRDIQRQYTVAGAAEPVLGQTVDPSGRYPARIGRR